MKKTLSAGLAVAGLLMAASAHAVGLTPTFISPGPGINAPLATSGSTVNYGQKTAESGLWTYSGTDASANTNGEYLRYVPTLETQTSGPVTAMPTGQDWLMQFDYKHTGGFTSANLMEWPFRAKTQADLAGEQKVVRLEYTGNGTTDSWAIFKGAAGGGWDGTPIINGLALGSDWNTFSFLYNSGTQTIDAYLNGGLIVNDFTLSHNDYAVDFVQFEYSKAGTDFFRNMTVSQYAVPEPSAIFLIGMGGALVWAQRRYRFGCR